jgi:hypothetical protein
MMYVPALQQDLSQSLLIFGCVLMGGLYIWAIYDAFTYTDYGFAWSFVFAVLPPVVPIYLAMSLYARRSVSQAGNRFVSSEDSSFRFSTEIERARFIEAADKGQGTLYEPAATLGSGGAAGRKVFTDHHAEGLIAGGDDQAALAYLLEMYTLAEGDGDPDRLSTYRHYILSVPGGTEALARAKAKRGDPDRPDTEGKRSVPF